MRRWKRCSNRARQVGLHSGVRGCLRYFRLRSGLTVYSVKSFNSFLESPITGLRKQCLRDAKNAPIATSTHRCRVINNPRPQPAGKTAENGPRRPRGGRAKARYGRLRRKKIACRKLLCHRADCTKTRAVEKKIFAGFGKGCIFATALARKAGVEKRRKDIEIFGNMRQRVSRLARMRRAGAGHETSLGNNNNSYNEEFDPGSG